jgi:hypothetical protein
VSEDRWDDETLLRELGEALHDPDDLLTTIAAQGRAIFGWRTVDTDLELARLDVDSAVQESFAVRSEAPELRFLVFNAQPLSVELEVSHLGITGQIVPPSRGRVVMESAGGPPVEVETDDVGFFRLAPSGPGPVRLRCETETGRLVTEWVRL